MAIYKLFPYKDSTLYSFYPDMNTGIDPINQISNLNIAVASNPQVARFMTELVQSEIEDVINNKISGSDWDVEFKSFIATAEAIVEATDIAVYPVGQFWYNGTGTYLGVPQTTDGCTWNSPNFKGSITWSGSGEDEFGNTITGSYNATYAPQGGGAWLLNSGSTNFKVTQSFDTTSTKDLKVNAKEVVSRWYSGSMNNYGFIVNGKIMLNGILMSKFNP